MALSACTFLASFPPIMTAIKVFGSGDGMRIQLDIPESEMGNALELLTMRQCVLRITIEKEENCKTVKNNAISTGTKW
jgi:hypothetical protein